MVVFIIILVLLLAFVAVININAARLKTPEISQEKKELSVEVDTELAAEHLSQMIRCKTVSSKNEEEIVQEEFEKFRALLPKLYPTVYEKSEKKNAMTGNSKLVLLFSERCRLV